MSNLETSWSFTLPYPRPPAGLSANDRPNHWGVKAKSTAMVRLAVFAAVRHAQVPALERCRVDVVWVVSDRRRRDSDNPSGLLKAIFDGIGADKGMSARIVDDDAPEFMTKGPLKILYVEGSTPHFEVTITDLGSAE